MKVKLLFIFSFLFSFLFKAQDIDKLPGISYKYHDQEIRIYKDRGNTNGGLVFRIYKENTVWKAERIQWFLPNQISPDKFDIVPPQKAHLYSNKNLQVVFMNLEVLNIGS